MENFSVVFWLYEHFARYARKLLGKQLVVRKKNIEEIARYALLVIMFVIQGKFACYTR